jgi:hypothetical protein
MKSSRLFSLSRLTALAGFGLACLSAGAQPFTWPGWALHFNPDSQQYVTVPASPSLTPNNFTFDLALWTPLTNLTADGTGRFKFTALPASNYPAGFFRLTQP